jgi:predicted membrane-bound dolichyl-phosphate-mannose-protein mannosyltransferase
MEKIKAALIKLGNWQYFGLLLLVLFSFFLHIALITQPGEPLFDEIHYVKDARYIIANHATERPEHPPVGKLFIVAGIKIFGDNPWGWRMPAVILSTIGIVLFYDICRRLGASHKMAFLATFLLVFENLTFIHSGMAMLDIYVLFFTILAFWLYLKDWWELAAVSIALAGLSKLSGVLAIIPIGLHWFFIGYKKHLPKTPLSPDAGRFQRFIYHYGSPSRFILAMALAPIAFILLMPAFDYMIGGQWINPISQIKNMSELTTGITFDAYIDPATNLFKAPLPSRPWEWLLSPTGSFYAYGWLFNSSKYTLAVLSYWFNPDYTGILSPTIWFAGLFVIPFLIWRCFKKENPAIFALCWIIGTWFVWIPLSLITYRVSFIFYYLPTTGALCIGTMLILKFLMDKAQARPAGKSKRFLELTVALFLLLHMVCFCWIAPVKLWVSIPACIMMLGFTLDYIGYNWKLQLSPEPVQAQELPVPPADIPGQPAEN